MDYGCRADGCDGILRPLGRYLECPECHETYSKGSKGIKKIPGPKQRSPGQFRKYNPISRGNDSFDDGIFYIANPNSSLVIPNHRNIRIVR